VAGHQAAVRPAGQAERVGEVPVAGDAELRGDVGLERGAHVPARQLRSARVPGRLVGLAVLALARLPLVAAQDEVHADVGRLLDDAAGERTDLTEDGVRVDLAGVGAEGLACLGVAEREHLQEVHRVRAHLAEVVAVDGDEAGLLVARARQHLQRALQIDQVPVRPVLPRLQLGVGGEPRAVVARQPEGRQDVLGRAEHERARVGQDGGGGPAHAGRAVDDQRVDVAVARAVADVSVLRGGAHRRCPPMAS
ncbi:MAG: hypothetical protein ACK559_40090, partial [bacterium]